MRLQCWGMSVVIQGRERMEHTHGSNYIIRSVRCTHHVIDLYIMIHRTIHMIVREDMYGCTFDIVEMHLSESRDLTAILNVYHNHIYLRSCQSLFWW